MSVKEHSQRLFFALWPDENVRSGLVNVAHQADRLHQGRLIKPANLHLTLAFLGNVVDSKMGCVQQMAASISFQPFSLSLQTPGFFKQAQVLWLGLHASQEVPAELVALASQLSRGAESCGIEMDKRALTPHITLLRKVKIFHDFSVEPLNWSASDFCLVSSTSTASGVDYKVIKRWGK